jgi:hypothetical protein
VATESTLEEGAEPPVTGLSVEVPAGTAEAPVGAVEALVGTVEAPPEPSRKRKGFSSLK